MAAADVGLTITQYKIVTLLVSHKGTIYDTAHYAGFVAGSGAHGYNTNVRSHVKRIRRKFAAVDPGFSEIETAWRAPVHSGEAAIARC